MQRWAQVLLATFLVTASPAYSRLLPGEQNTIRIFERAAPLVVNVHRIRRVIDTRFILHDVETGTASGFLWNNEGYIVTNYHVIRNSNRVAVTMGRGTTVSAKIVGTAPRKDIALLKLEKLDVLQQLPSFSSMPLADSSQLQVGQQTIAIGNPFGLDRTLTTGIVSATGREIRGVAGLIRDMVQTDASINPGNSGGPLLDSQGQLIGMNTMIYSKSGASVGIGFAVPANTIKRVINQLIKYGKVKHPGIGVQIFNDQIARYLGVKGVIISAVTEDSPAAKAGIIATYRDDKGQINIGDIIVGVNGKPVNNYNDLYLVLDDVTIGDTITIKLKRDDKERSLDVQTIDGTD